MEWFVDKTDKFGYSYLRHIFNCLVNPDEILMLQRVDWQSTQEIDLSKRNFNPYHEMKNPQQLTSLLSVNNTYPKSSIWRGGFALVATILLMVLLAIITIGTLSLSVVTLRTSGQDSAQARARANARMALMIAVGELQKNMGPDQRISANSNIIDPVSSNILHRHWTGAWDSWVAGSLSDAPINSEYPSTESHHQTIGAQPDNTMSPAYSQKNLHFRAWLASLNDNEATDPNIPKTLNLNANSLPDINTEAIHLVGAGSLGKSAATTDYVSARLIKIKDQSTFEFTTGRYGWWVGDESQKARIMADSYTTNPVTLTTADHINRSQVPGSMSNTTILGLEGMTDERELNRLASHKTLDLVTVNPLPADGVDMVSQRNFHHATTHSFGLLADVREGGLKRDLSTLLERPISLSETGDDFMLYRFDTSVDDRVPLQDLAAYYQLYQNDPTFAAGKRGGIAHNAAPGRVMQVNMPDLGATATRDRFTREYTTLYRSPVPVRVQFVLGVGATTITPAERAAVAARGTTLRATDTYKLLLGVKPVVSLWNPNNTPLVMGTDASQIMKVGFPPFTLRWRKYRAAGAPARYVSEYVNLNYAISNESTDSDARARSLGPYIMQLQFANTTPIVFQPGEVKMFSIPIAATNFLETGGNSSFANSPLYQAQSFLPDGFYVTAKTAAPRGIDVVHFPNSAGSFVNYAGKYMVFGDGDGIDFQVEPEAGPPAVRSRSVSNANEVYGSGFQFWMADEDYATNATTAHFRNYQFISRFGGSSAPDPTASFSLNSSLMLSGFPNRAIIPYEGITNATPGSEIKAATDSGEAKGLLLFTMMTGAEVHSSNSPGAGAGRRITTRPFLHGSTLSGPQITNDTRGALYDYGWEWQVEKINDVEEAFQDDGSARGYYGGGYTVGAGVTHVVQQYLPALPPISIASLSNARLGGFSLADAPVMAAKTDDIVIGNVRNANFVGSFRQVTATGQGGLAPHSLQSIGNSYAHPNIPANQAFTTYTQFLNTDTDTGNPPQRTYADHSYLSNKALWDDYYFSSIAPQLSNQLNGGALAKSATEVAYDFFVNGISLPNRRILPYSGSISAAELTTLTGQLNTYTDGFADKIATYLLVSGPFNINSTSVEAWKVFFSSLKGKPLAHLENQAATLSTTTPIGVPATPGILANGAPINSSALSNDPNAPPEQWTSPRSLSDQEINELAVAMVEQVKTRGPFLSLSEFINRRLDGSNEELALKGALQAALDDDSVSINAAFRTAERSFNIDGSTETIGMTTAFTKALEGPIAYGSTPYVDQADILRHMGSVLTPRGDTFVVRAYGDSLAKNGNVEARAWCEAIIQRTPDYVDTSDDAHLKQSDLLSESNKRYGRKFNIISFRWLNVEEV